MIIVNSNCVYAANFANQSKLVWKKDGSMSYIIKSASSNFILDDLNARVFFLSISPMKYRLTDSLLKKEHIVPEAFWSSLFLLLSENLVTKCASLPFNEIPTLYSDTFITRISSFWVIGNIHNGAIDYLNDDLAILLLENQLNSVPSPAVELLCSRGYASYCKTHHSLSTSTPEISENYLVLSYNCNLDCIYCFEKHSNKECFDMSEETLDYILKKLNRNPFPQRIVLYGGEPLLPSTTTKVKKVVDFVRKKPNCSLRIITNGVNVIANIPLFNTIKEKIHSFTITLDGDQHIHNSRRVFKSGKGSYEIVLHSVQALLSNGFNCFVRINLDSTNYTQIESLIHELNSYPNKQQITIFLARVENPTDSSFSPLSLSKVMKAYYSIRSLTDIQIISNIPILQYAIQCDLSTSNIQYFFPIRSMYCSTAQLNIFDTDGKIYGCNEAMGDSAFKKKDVGSAVSSDFCNVTPISCQSCNIFSLCLGNCPRINRFSRDFGNFRCEKSEIEDALQILCEKSDLHIITYRGELYPNV